MDNQLFIGVILFGGLAYFIISQKEDGQTKKARVQQNERDSMYEELDKLKSRVADFTTNDEKKGKFRDIAPLGTDEFAGLAEVVTRLKELDKRQSRTQAFDRDEARRLHGEVSDLDAKARTFMDRYDRQQKSKDKDMRTIAKDLSTAGGTIAAMKRGMISHSRSVHSRGASFVKDTPPALPTRSASAKKRKPNFKQNTKPDNVFSAAQPSDNVADENMPSAFETSQARDDSHDHGTANARLEEATASGAHGKNGAHIRPVRRTRSLSRIGDIENTNFNQAPGAVDDNKDRVQRTVQGEDKTGGDVAVLDLAGSMSRDTEMVMEAELVDSLEKLQNGTLKLTQELDVKYRSIVALIYGDDPTEGDSVVQELIKYRARDMGLGIIAAIPSNPQDPVPRRNKRPLSQVLMDPAGRKEKLTITEIHTGQRVKVTRGSAVGPRSSEPPPSRTLSAGEVGYSDPRSTAGRSSRSRQRAYETELELASVAPGSI